MRPVRQDLNVKKIHLGPVANWMGDRHPVAPVAGATGTYFWKFPYSTYIFEILFF